MSKKVQDSPKFLGKQVRSSNRLDPILWRGKRPTYVTLHCSEMHSHCPVTGQPDFSQLKIEYIPDLHIVETKSLKLFLQSFSRRKKFNELIVDEVCDKFASQVKPQWVKVTGVFNTRGGISVEPQSEYHKTNVSLKAA